MSNKFYMMMPTSYVSKLQQKGKRDKARAFMEYFYDMHDENINSIRFYQNSWGLKSSNTSGLWIKEFKEEIAKFFTFWELKNNSHYSNVKNEIAQKSHTLKNEIAQENSIKVPIKTISNQIQSHNLKNQIAQEKHEDFNSNISNNINADSNESTDKISDKANKNYGVNFEILWNRYDKKTSNKGRSQTIYNRRWKNTDIKIMLEAIDKYKASIDLTYLKDFDGFLNGLIDTYIPKRAWVLDKNGTKHIGWFYDIENKFISDSNLNLKLESSNIANYITDKRFGYIGA